MKEIKLTRKNQYKWCPKCKEVQKIIMKGFDGFCEACDEFGVETRVYTIDNYMYNKRRKREVYEKTNNN